MKIKWLGGKNASCLYISSKRLLGSRDFPNRVLLHFGKLEKEVMVKVNQLLPQKTISLSANVFDPYSIPTHLPYDIKISGNHIFIGPVIGMIVPAAGRLDRYADYFREYRNIGGLICLFTAKDIHPIDQTISGYYYDPPVNGKSSNWNEIVMPYPDIVYRRVFSSDIPLAFVKEMGDKLFNPTIFDDKWKLWRILFENSAVCRHLPHTQRLNSIHDLDLMLQSNASVYVKRNQTLQALGLFMVQKTETGYLFVDRDRNEIMIQSNAAPAFINNLIKNYPYIVQQAVPLKYHGRHVDFRVIMQKGRTKEWACMGILARFGAKGSVSTNFTEGGKLEAGKPALQQIFRLSKKQAAEKIQEIIQICQKSCERIDQFGNFADVGLDIVVDPDMKIWILEINKFHQNNLPLYIPGNREMYINMMRRPFEYAKTLAGF